MARKGLKREPTTVVQSQVDDHPMSSGDTIVMDPDVTMTEGPVDEGYHTNHEAKINGGYHAIRILNCY